MSIIETHELTRFFGNKVAVQDLTLNVEKGEILGLLGPNGAGKTTTIRMLTGTIFPTRGFATIDGLRTDQDVEKLHETIGIVADVPGFYSRLSAKRNLEFFGGFYKGIDLEAQIEKYLKSMGLWDRRNDKVGSFSKGMKQRLALARALLHEPQVLFLDEPTAGLDPEIASEVRDLVKTLSENGQTIFFSTHNLAEAEQLCSRVAIISSRLLVLDKINNLRSRLFERQIIVQLENLDQSIVAAVKRLSFVDRVEREDNKLILELREIERNRPDVVKTIVDAGGRILEVSEARHALEEVYLKLIHEESK
jgi:ABC-2 type transport system ATP-binding protein